MGGFAPRDSSSRRIVQVAPGFWQDSNDRPKGMHRARYNRLREEDVLLNASEHVTPSESYLD
jgi:hypothetical protein